MLILVKFRDSRMEYMNSKRLDMFIELNLVDEFKRSTGWVKVGVDAIRKLNRKVTFS